MSKRSWPVLIAWMTALMLGLAAFLIHQQGIRLQADGLWLLAARFLLENGDVHGHLATSRAPLDHLLLTAIFLIAGKSALSLAILKSLLTATGCGFGFHLARRQGAGVWSWIALPLGWGLSIISTSMLLLAWLASSLQARRRHPHALLPTISAAICLILLPLAGLGAVVGGSILMLLYFLLERGKRPTGIEPFRWENYLHWAMLLIFGLLAIFQLSIRPMGEDLLLTPLHDFARHLQQGGLVDGFDLLLDPSEPARTFPQIQTGESIPAQWPAQIPLRKLSLRLLLLWIWIVPLHGTFLWWRKKLPEGSTAFLALAWMGPISLATGVHFHSLIRAAYAGLPLVPVLLAGASAREPGRMRSLRLGRWAWILLTIGAFLPGSVENIWLASRTQREGLQRWNPSTAGILMSAETTRQWESLHRGLEGLHTSRTLIWPAHSGLHFLLDIPLAHRQAWLPGRAFPHEGEMLEEFRRNPPEYLFLGLSWHFSSQQLRERIPELFSFFRHDYRILGNTSGSGDSFRILEHIPDEDPRQAQMSLQETLPQVELSVINDVSPALRPDLTVGQTVKMGSEDLSGIAIRWNTQGTDIEVPVRIHIWMRRGEVHDALLDFFDLQVQIPGDGHRSFIRLGPVPETAGTDLAITLELRDTPDSELRLYSHRHDDEQGEKDLYREGTAILNRSPLPADLYFLVY